MVFVEIEDERWNHKTAENQSDMMKTKQDEYMMGRDTDLCGDPKTWFPMRVTYQREKKVKAELDRLGVESVVGKEGKRVEIISGAFEGVTGVIRRVKRCKRVVVELEGIASVAIAFVPAGLLKEIDNM